MVVDVPTPSQTSTARPCLTVVATDVGALLSDVRGLSASELRSVAAHYQAGSIEQEDPATFLRTLATALERGGHGGTDTPLAQALPCSDSLELFPKGGVCGVPPA